jgi:hypothetical protein
LAADVIGANPLIGRERFDEQDRFVELPGPSKIVHI